MKLIFSFTTLLYGNKQLNIYYLNSTIEKNLLLCSYHYDEQVCSLVIIVVE